MKILDEKEFDGYWKTCSAYRENDSTESAVAEIISAVRREGDAAVKRYAALFDRSSPARLEIPPETIRAAMTNLKKNDPTLAGALEFSAGNILKFSRKQRDQFQNFEIETEQGLFTGQRTIPVESAGVYVPGGRYPLISSALMCLIPAFSAGVENVCFASPPGDDGLPDWRVLAGAGIAAESAGRLESGFRAFAMGGAQAVAALALGTETVPRCAVVAGPGNRFVARAKRALFGETGIDFIAGPSDILVIMDENAPLDLAAIDMLAQAEHDADARARALVPSFSMADALSRAIEARLESSDAEASKKTARSSLDSGGLIIVYGGKANAGRIANIIAPEHLELQVANPETWVPALKNYGSLFIGNLSAEVLGDYSAGLNHTLPTSGTARFTGGLSVRHFLKTVTTLRCEKGAGYGAALEAASVMGRAENLMFHAASAAAR